MLALSVAALSMTMSSPALTPALKLRGGLAGIDGEEAAKYFVLLSGINAGLDSIDGAKSVPDVVESWVNSGTLTAAVGYYMFADAVLNKKDTAAAVVASNIPALVAGVKGWLNGGKAIDLSPSNVGLIITAFLTYCLHTGTILDGDVALKVVAALGLINGLGGMFASDLVAKLPWDGAGDAVTAAGVGASVLALTMGKSATEAIAFSLVPALYKSIDGMFISKDASGDANINAIMALFQAVVVASNLA